MSVSPISTARRTSPTATPRVISRRAAAAAAATAVVAARADEVHVDVRCLRAQRRAQSRAQPSLDEGRGVSFADLDSPPAAASSAASSCAAAASRALRAAVATRRALFAAFVATFAAAFAFERAQAAPWGARCRSLN